MRGGDCEDVPRRRGRGVGPAGHHEPHGPAAGPEELGCHLSAGLSSSASSCSDHTAPSSSRPSRSTPAAPHHSTAHRRLADVRHAPPLPHFLFVLKYLRGCQLQAPSSSLVSHFGTRAFSIHVPSSTVKKTRSLFGNERGAELGPREETSLSEPRHRNVHFTSLPIYIGTGRQLVGIRRPGDRAALARCSFRAPPRLPDTR